MRSIVFVLFACLPAWAQGFSAEYPAWQRLLAEGLPDAWQTGESFARCWQGEAPLQSVSLFKVAGPCYVLPARDPAPAADASGTEAVPEDVAPATTPESLAVALLCFDVDAGPLRLLLPAPDNLPEAGVSYRLTVCERQGFGGRARGLILEDAAGQVLLYDDGGYGPAFQSAPARRGLELGWAADGPQREAWETPPVDFRLGDASLSLREGGCGDLGQQRVQLLVARIWRGKPPTDVDLSPMAYLVTRKN